MSDMYCTQCGNTGSPSVGNRGSVVIFLFLLLLFIIPGLFYLIYMITGRVYKCKNCKAEGMIPTDSPIAQKALNQSS